MARRISSFFIIASLLLGQTAASQATAQNWEDSDEEVYVYIGQITLIAKIMVESMEMATAALELDPSRSGASAADLDLTIADLAATFTIFVILQDAFSYLTPPPDLEEMHQVFGAAIDSVADIAEFCKRGIITIDMAIVNGCSDSLSESFDLLSEFFSQVE